MQFLSAKASLAQVSGTIRFQKDSRLFVKKNVCVFEYFYKSGTVRKTIGTVKNPTGTVTKPTGTVMEP